MTDLTGSPHVSPQGLILYKQMLDDTAFIKRQQWATTNYAALIYGAIIWLKDHIASDAMLLCIFSDVIVIVGIISIGLLFWFQWDLGLLRKRIESANNYCFDSTERAAFVISEKDQHPFGRGWHILVSLIAVCFVGACLTLFALHWAR